MTSSIAAKCNGQPSLYFPAVTAEFNVWLLIVGLVVGAGLVWLVIMDSRRRESEIDEVELPQEAAWLSAVMADDGYDVSPEAAERLLLLHRAYLEAAPPDGAIDDHEADEPSRIAVDDPSDVSTPRWVTESTDGAVPPASRAPADPVDPLRRSS
jgi:hypothetical protein